MGLMHNVYVSNIQMATPETKTASEVMKRRLNAVERHVLQLKHLAQLTECKCTVCTDSRTYDTTLSKTAAELDYKVVKDRITSIEVHIAGLYVPACTCGPCVYAALGVRPMCRCPTEPCVDGDGNCVKPTGTCNNDVGHCLCAKSADPL